MAKPPKRDVVTKLAYYTKQGSRIEFAGGLSLLKAIDYLSMDLSLDEKKAAIDKLTLRREKELAQELQKEAGL